jgi:hypothetical protein
MAKKETPKPLFSLKRDFYASLDRVAQDGIMLIQTVETILQHGKDKIPAADILEQRLAAFRSALSRDEK